MCVSDSEGNPPGSLTYDGNEGETENIPDVNHQKKKEKKKKQHLSGVVWL